MAAEVRYIVTLVAPKVCAAGLVLLGMAACAPASGQTAGELMRQAETDFLAGRVEASMVNFDLVAQQRPDVAPQLWQRGIALYYAGRYAECRQQFESHRLVNPADVENAAWHFLCVARSDGSEAALAALLPVGRDGRSPMPEIYEMFGGRMTEEEVLTAAGDNARGQFYAYLYLGLYREALGQTSGAREAILLAADDRFAAAGGYMHGVAVVHRDRLGR
jgi:lipoprotein NlpI